MILRTDKYLRLIIVSHIINNNNKLGALANIYIWHAPLINISVCGTFDSTN